MTKLRLSESKDCLQALPSIATSTKLSDNDPKGKSKDLALYFFLRETIARFFALLKMTFIRFSQRKFQ